MTNEESKSRESRKNALKDDVVWSNVDVEQGDDVSLQPIDPATTAVRRSMRDRDSVRPRLSPEIVEEPTPFQFSIKQMLIANAVLAVSFGLMRWFAPSGMAGMLGVATIVSAVLIVAFKPEHQGIQKAWWCLFGLYAMACLFAIVGRL